MSFVHLHVHSYYSLLEGTAAPEALVARARQLNFTQLALTDRNGLYGAVAFSQCCREQGIRPIIGATVELADGSTVVLLVRSQSGYENLCRLLSDARLRGGHLGFRLTLREILPHREGLFLLSGGQRGRLWQLLQARNLTAAQQYCREVKNWFGNSFCVELQIFHPNDRLRNIRQRDLARQFGLPLVASNGVHLLERQDFPRRRLLRAIAHNTLVDKVCDAGSPEQYLKSAEEMNRLFRDYPQALRNTEILAQHCRFQFRLGKPVFPKLKLPDKETSYSYLWKRAFEGTQARYPVLNRQVTSRLGSELEVINELGFSDYFLIVKDIVDFCNREGIPCVGRGSAGDSLVSYVLGITHADPLRYHLYFERFLNRERTDPPDIDLDICWKSRDRVLNYVYERYGSHRVAMICTFNTFQTRSAIRDVARAYGFPENEINTLTKYLPHYGLSRLAQSLGDIPECRHLAQQSAALEEVLQLARQISGFPRHLSIHPGGIVIAPEDIRKHTPLEVAGKGIVISQYDMHSIEDLGLVKIDLLGVRSLSIVTECLEAVKKVYRDLQGEKAAAPRVVYRYDIAGQGMVAEDPRTYLTPERFAFLRSDREQLSPLDLRLIPDRDPNAIALFRAGLSMGCFQTESPGMRALLKKMQIDGVEDIIIAVALIRPGAADSGARDQYIARRAGLKPVTYPHPALAPLLQETCGEIIYQEQIMQVAAAVANFSLAQADQLRRVLGKGRAPQAAAQLRRAFLEGARQNQITGKPAEAVWNFLADHVGYGFNKAHAATYGIIAYQTAYLKSYFPVPYLTAVLNNPGGFYSRAAYAEECRRMGIVLLPPDVNESDRHFTGAGNAIRTGLDAVAELTRKTRERILTERAKAPFRDYFDFMQRVQPRQKEAEHLIKCGALRSLESSEPLLLIQNKVYFQNRRNRNLTTSMLYHVNLAPYKTAQRIVQEMKLLDFAVSDHPLALFQRQIDWEAVVPSTELEQHCGRRVQFAGWLVTSRRITTQNGEFMKFLTLEDFWGLCEAVLFSRVYQKYGHLIQSKGPYLLRGVVQSRMPGEANLIVEELAVVKL